MSDERGIFMPTLALVTAVNLVVYWYDINMTIILYNVLKYYFNMIHGLIFMIILLSIFRCFLLQYIIGTMVVCTYRYIVIIWVYNYQNNIQTLFRKTNQQATRGRWVTSNTYTRPTAVRDFHIIILYTCTYRHHLKNRVLDTQPIRVHERTPSSDQIYDKRVACVWNWKPCTYKITFHCNFSPSGLYSSSFCAERTQ